MESTVPEVIVEFHEPMMQSFEGREKVQIFFFSPCNILLAGHRATDLTLSRRDWSVLHSSSV